MQDLDSEHFTEVYLKKMKIIEDNLVQFLEKLDSSIENYNFFNDLLQEQKLSDDKYGLKLFLYLIVAFSNHYHRSPQFFGKIEQIIDSMKGKIQAHFTNSETFHIFQTSKRLLHFLIKRQIFTPTDETYTIIKNDTKYTERKYLEYFYPELERYMPEKVKHSIRSQIEELNYDEVNVFFEKREKGENDGYITELIRKDQVVEFISHLNKSNISPTSTIQPSIYETNLFLINKQPSLIEYSAFCGSIQIFRYLYQQNVELKSSIWLYAIHGRNAEIIHFLEEQRIPTFCDSFQYLIVESIKCHHNELADYFRTNFNENDQTFSNYYFRKSLKYYNFSFFESNDINSLIEAINDQSSNLSYYLCKYDYDSVFDFLSTSNMLDINYTYTIYKPVIQKEENIVSYIEIALGNVDTDLKKDYEKYGQYKYDEETTTLLNISTRKGNIDLVKHLLNIPGINLNAKTKKISKKNHKNSLLESLGYKQYYITTEEMNILHEAVESDYIEIVQIILNNNKEIDVNSSHLLYTVYLDCISSARNFYNEENESPLFNYAVERENIGIVKLLLDDKRVNINLKSASTIKEGGGCITYSYSLVRHEKTPLYFPIVKENLEIIKILLDHPRFDVDFQSLSYIKYIEGRPKYESAVNLAYHGSNHEIYELIKSRTKDYLIDFNFFTEYK